MSLDVIGIIGSLGFPIFVTLWFMWRTEKILNNNTMAMQKLITVVEKLCTEVNESHGRTK